MQLNSDEIKELLTQINIELCGQTFLKQQKP